MTPNPVTEEWRRAQDCLGAAWVCQEAGFYADAISRAYYAVLHAARAVLELHGIRAKTHDGVINMFGQNVVMPGLVERQWGREIPELHYLRSAADYRVDRVFEESESLNTCDRAQAFLNRIRPLLGDAVPSEGPEAPPAGLEKHA